MAGGAGPARPVPKPKKKDPRGRSGWEQVAETAAATTKRTTPWDTGAAPLDPSEYTKRRDFRRWIEAANATPEAPNDLGGGGDGGYGAWLSGQQSSTNQMYDDMLGLLGKQVAGGKQAIGAAHRQLAEQLAGLNQSSQAENRRIASQTASRGRQSLQDLSRGYGGLEADLARSGADLKALLAERGNSRAALRSGSDRNRQVGTRLAELLAGDMANYQRLGETAQTSYMDALSSAEALQRAQIEMQREQALAALAGGGGGGGSFGGGGGSSSSSGSGDPMYDLYTALNQGKSIADDQAWLGESPEYSSLRKLLNGEMNDVGRNNTQQLYRDLMAGAITPEEALARFNATPTWGVTRSKMENILMDADREWRDLQARRATVGQIAGVPIQSASRGPSAEEQRAAARAAIYGR